MRDGKTWLWLSVFAAGLSGCTNSTATITSYVSKDEHIAINRLLIVSRIWPTSSSGATSALQMPVLETAVTEALAKCGIVVNVLPQDQLSLPGDDAQAGRTNSSDAVLVLETKTFETGIAEGGGVYSANLIGMATKKMVWQAEIRIETGASREEAFAASIVDRLKGDSILPASCPTPVVPTRGI